MCFNHKWKTNLPLGIDSKSIELEGKNIKWQAKNGIGLI